MTIKSGKVDVGGMSENTYLRLFEAGKLAPEDMVILWRSEPIPTGPISVRSDLPEALKKRIQQAYIAIRTENPQLWNDIVKASRREDMWYIAADDSMWNPLRRIANNLESLEIELAIKH